MLVFGGKGYLIAPFPLSHSAANLLAHSLLRGQDLSLDEWDRSRRPLESCILKEESGEIWYRSPLGCGEHTPIVEPEDFSPRTSS